MNTILIIVLICGIALLALYHRPEHDSVAELKQWLSGQLSAISEDLANDIERDQQGQYPHRGKPSFKPKGSITYTLLDKNLSRFELSQFSELTAEDVKSTAGYAQLKAVVDELARISHQAACDADNALVPTRLSGWPRIQGVFQACLSRFRLVFASVSLLFTQTVAIATLFAPERR